MENKPISHIVAGCVIAAVSIVLFLAYYYTGLSFEQNIWSWIPLVVVMLLIIFFIIQYGKANDNRLTFGQLFGYGFKVTIIFVLIATVFTVLVVYFFPEYKVKFMEAMYTRMEEDQNVPEEQKETAINAFEKYFSIMMIGGGLFMNMIFGTIAALVGAAVTKKHPHTPFDTKA